MPQPRIPGHNNVRVHIQHRNPLHHRVNDNHDHDHNDDGGHHAVQDAEAIRRLHEVVVDETRQQQDQGGHEDSRTAAGNPAYASRDNSPRDPNLNLVLKQDHELDFSDADAVAARHRELDKETNELLQREREMEGFNLHQTAAVNDAIGNNPAMDNVNVINNADTDGTVEYEVAEFDLGDLTLPVNLDLDLVSMDSSDEEMQESERGQGNNAGLHTSQGMGDAEYGDEEEDGDEVYSEEEGDVDLFAADGVFEDDVAAFDDAMGANMDMGGAPLPPARRRANAAPGRAGNNVNAHANFPGQAPVDADPDVIAAQAAQAAQDAEIEAEVAAGLQDGGFALEELMGLRGDSLLRLIKNVMFLLVFNLVYIGIVCLVPNTIGLKMQKALLLYGDRLHTNILVPAHDAVDAFSPLILQYVGALYEWSRISLIAKFINNVRATSNVVNDVIKIDDLLLIALGYLSLFLFVFLLGQIFSSMVPTTAITTHTFFRKLSTNILALHKTAKVGSLLFLRILVLPIIMGVTLISLINNYVLFYTSDSFSRFIAIYILGFTGLAWVVGITFMLVITLSILQLREVLHPDLLGKVIRPQETQVELMQSLMYDNCFVHSKRMISSALVYLSIACIYVYVPLKLYYTAVTWNDTAHSDTDGTNVHPPLFTIYSGLYYCQEIQLPLELTALHLCLLSGLEKRKNIIGRLQHRLLLYITDKLNMSRMLLPFRMRMRRRANGDREPYTDAAGELVVKGPMKRPPKGWDSRKRTDVGRWSWNDDFKPPVQQEVAPRIAPSNWLIKLIVLFLLQWVIVVILLFSHIILPVVTGRTVMGLLQVPEQYLHDPLNYVLGMVVLMQLFAVARYLIENNNIYSCIATMIKIPFAFSWLLQLMLMFVIVSLTCGMVMSTLGNLITGISAASTELWSLHSSGKLNVNAATGLFRHVVSSGFKSYGVGAACVSAGSCGRDHIWTVLTEFTSQLIHVCFFPGAGVVTVVLWAFSSGFFRQLLAVLQLVPVLGNIGGPLLQQVPDWRGITMLFVRDLQAGAVERMLIHMQLLRSSLLTPLRQYFCSPWTYLNPVTAVVCSVSGVIFFWGGVTNQYSQSTDHSVSMLVALVLSTSEAAVAATHMLHASTVLLRAPLMGLYHRLHRKIRDDMFLTGRQLQHGPHHNSADLKDTGASTPTQMGAMTEDTTIAAQN